MGEYNFDNVIERRGTGSLKADKAAKLELPENTIPLWVADMDFETAPEIKEALMRTVEHGIYGYPIIMESYETAVQDWFLNRFGWETKKEWMLQTPGVVFALAAAVRAFTREGDNILIQRPVYYPFSYVIQQNGRKLLNNPLVFKDGRYQMDLDDFEDKIIKNNVKLFLLCSPHNPVSRVWTREELKKVGEICARHHVFVVADEIHCDFIFPGNVHTNFATLGPDIADNCMVCTAPSKTFNLAGLQLSNIFIPNGEKRKLMQKELDRIACLDAGVFGIAACQAAYTKGAPWLQSLLEYLGGSVSLVRSYLEENLPEVKLVEPEGTYLLWLDFRACGYDDVKLAEKMKWEAAIWMDEGTMFGPEGAGFMRMNIASPRSILKESLERLLVFRTK